MSIWHDDVSRCADCGSVLRNPDAVRPPLRLSDQAIRDVRDNLDVKSTMVGSVRVILVNADFLEGLCDDALVAHDLPNSFAPAPDAATAEIGYTATLDRKITGVTHASMRAAPAEREWLVSDERLHALREKIAAAKPSVMYSWDLGPASGAGIVTGEVSGESLDALVVDALAARAALLKAERDRDASKEWHARDSMKFAARLSAAERERDCYRSGAEVKAREADRLRAALSAAETQVTALRETLAGVMRGGIELGTVDPAWVVTARAVLNNAAPVAAAHDARTWTAGRDAVIAMVETGMLQCKCVSRCARCVEAAAIVEAARNMTAPATWVTR